MVSKEIILKNTLNYVEKLLFERNVLGLPDNHKTKNLLPQWSTCRRFEVQQRRVINGVRAFAVGVAQRACTLRAQQDILAGIFFANQRKSWKNTKTNFFGPIF